MVRNEDGDWGLSLDTGFTVNRYEDGSIDWNDPRIISPNIKENEEVDWYRRFEAAFNQFVRLGVAVRRIPRG